MQSFFNENEIHEELIESKVNSKLQWFMIMNQWHHLDTNKFHSQTNI